MLAVAKTVAFSGIEALPVEVQVSVLAGLPSFSIVGLPDKAVAESRERIRAAIFSLGIALPPKKITVNLSPADLQKEGSHFDLPITMALLVTLQILSPEEIQQALILGELALDGRILPVNGVLPAALNAADRDLSIVCPQENGPEAAWAQDIEIIAAPNLLSLMNHYKGKQVLARPTPRVEQRTKQTLDLLDIKGQETAKRALEITAAGGHNLLLQGPPGSGKSMLASRLPSLLPPLSPKEALEVTMIHSIAGQLDQGQLIKDRPYRDPHHSASLAALVGGGVRAKPGEISLAHHGVLFLDELPEFARATLETLRQPLEMGKIMISRANAHISYPSRFQLVAAMNPCRCGYLDDPTRSCSKAPRCALDYQSKISGPLLDRIDLSVFVPAVKADQLSSKRCGESSKIVAARVLAAQRRQKERNQDLNDAHKSSRNSSSSQNGVINAHLTSTQVDDLLTIDTDAKQFLNQAVDKFNLSARSYYRLIRVAQTIADLEEDTKIAKHHVAEALGYRQSASLKIQKTAA